MHTIISTHLSNSSIHYRCIPNTSTVYPHEHFDGTNKLASKICFATTQTRRQYINIKGAYTKSVLPVLQMYLVYIHIKDMENSYLITNFSKK